MSIATNIGMMVIYPVTWSFHNVVLGNLMSK